MLEHQPDLSSHPQEALPASLCTPSDPQTEPAVIDPRVEDYLDRVCGPLVGIVPYEKRAEIRRELCEHLQALIATHEDLGSTREEAVTAALQQFGDPAKLAQHWLREWEYTDANAVPRFWRRSQRIALLTCGIAAAVATLILTVTGGAINNSDEQWLLIPLLFGLPLAAGTVVGLTAPKRPALAVLLALLQLLPLGTALLAVWAVKQRFLAGPILGVQLSGVFFGFWAILGTSAAGVSGWLRKQILRRRIRWILR
jgi:hypothetical protein